MNDQIYNEPLNYYHTTMDVGHGVKIFYNPYNPNVIMADGYLINTYAALIFALVGAVLLVMGILDIVRKRKMK